MCCAFEGAPQVVRLHGTGQALRLDSPEASALAPRFPSLPGARAIVVVDVHRVSSSCGFSIPLLAYEGERTRLIEWAEARGDDGVAAYHAEKNTTSIDGLTALSVRE